MDICSAAGSPLKKRSTHSSAATSPSNASAMWAANSSRSTSAGASDQRSRLRQRIDSSEGALLAEVWGTLSAIG